ncbi:MAG: putative porin, partial [Flammeovirgaceae bacterium]
MLQKIILLLVFMGIQYTYAQDRIDNFGNPDPFNTNQQRNDTSKVVKRKGKILNDSLQIIYGPHTTFHFYEKDWFNNTQKLYITDTTLTHFHRYNFVQQNENKLHNLGNLATPANPIFFQTPQNIGVRNGITAFDFIELDETNIKQFNTKSPHSSWYYAQGGQGRSFLDASLAQNINERINVGGLYRRLTNNLLIGTQRQDNQTRHADHQNIMLHASGVSKNQRYQVMGYLSFYRHRLTESGGLLYDQDTLTNLRSLYELEQGDLDNRLSDAEGLQQKNKMRLYHQYTLIDSSNFQLYHIFDWSSRKNTFQDATLDTIQQLYSHFYINKDTTSTSHRYRFNEMDHRLGVKWRHKQLFMAAYYRYKNFSAVHQPLSNEQVPYDLKNQHFLGFIGNYTINDTTQLLFEGEQLLFNDYRLSATLKTKFLTAKYTRAFYSPSLFEQYYYGNHFIWQNNNFDNTLTDELEGMIQIPLKKHNIRPYAKITNTVDYIYYNEQAMPEQADERITLLQIGMRFNGRLGKYFIYDGEFIYTENSNSTAFQVPRFFSNFQFALEKELFKGALPAQIGFDVHWRSAYFADA